MELNTRSDFQRQKEGEVGNDSEESSDNNGGNLKEIDLRNKSNEAFSSSDKEEVKRPLLQELEYKLSRQIAASVVASFVTLAYGLTEGYASPALDSLTSPMKNQSDYDNQPFDINHHNKLNNTLEYEIGFEWLQENGTDSSKQETAVENVNHISLSGYLIELVNYNEASWIGSLLFAGGFIGSLGSGFMVGLGRKTGMLVGSIPRIVSWFIIAFAKDINFIYAGRLLGGISAGLVTVACPLYISEISLPKHRGPFISTTMLFQNIGIFISYTLGKYAQWQYLSLICGVINLISTIPLLFVPETPQYLLSKNREDEARKSLEWLRGTRAVTKELEGLKRNQSLHVEQTAVTWKETLKDMISARIVLPVLILVTFMIIQKFSGYYSMLTYMALFLRKLPLLLSIQDTAILLSFIQVVSSLIAIWLVDISSKRYMGLVSSCVLSLCFLTLGINIYLSEAKYIVLPNYLEWIGFTALLGILVAFSAGLAQLKMMLIGELLPRKYKKITSAIVGSFLWISLFLSVKLFFKMADGMHMYGVMWFYSAVCGLGILFSLFCIPETKGEELHDIGGLLAKKLYTLRNPFGTFPQGTSAPT